MISEQQENVELKVFHETIRSLSLLAAKLNKITNLPLHQQEKNHNQHSLNENTDASIECITQYYLTSRILQVVRKLLEKQEVNVDHVNTISVRSFQGPPSLSGWRGKREEKKNLLLRSENEDSNGPPSITGWRGKREKNLSSKKKLMN